MARLIEMDDGTILGTTPTAAQRIARDIEENGKAAMEAAANEKQRAADFNPQSATIAALKEAALQAGISVPSTILPEGTALYAGGVSKLTADRKRWLAQIKAGLRADPAAAIVTEVIRREDKQDTKVVLSNVRMDRRGRLHGVAVQPDAKGEVANAFGYTPHALRQIVAQIPGWGPSFAPRGWASALGFLPGDLRAEAFNRQVQASPPSSAPIVFRSTRTDNGVQVLRAALTERYGDLSDLTIASEIQALPSEDLGSMALNYRPDLGAGRSQFELLMPILIPVKTFRVGDPHYATVVMDNSDTGQGAARVVPAIVRAACANLTLATGEGVTVSMRHLGSAERLHAQFRGALRQAFAAVDGLRVAVEQAAGVRVDTISKKPLAEVIQTLVKGLDLGQEAGEAWKRQYDQSYASQEQAPSLYGLHAALTESAQSSPWWQEQAEQEQAAAKLLQPVYVRTLLA